MYTKNKLPLRIRFAVSTAAIVFVLMSMWSVGGGFLNTKTATAATSSTLNFQARLMAGTGAIVPDGNYNIEFKLYNAASSSGSSQGACTGDSNCLWTETRTSANVVRVANGYLTVNLGSVTSLPAINWDQELWLTMNIGGTGTASWDGEMTPRLKLTAVPYAFRAGQLATLNGSNTSTLGFIQPTANRSILVPDESGTLCLQSSINCGFLTGSTGDYIQNNQTASPQSANIFLQNAGSTTGITMIVRASSGQTGNLLQFQDSTGAVINTLIKSTGAYYSTAPMVLGTLTTTPVAANLYVTTSTNTNISQVIRAKSGQTGDLFQIESSSGVPLLSIQPGGTLTLGNITTTAGQTAAGSLLFADGTLDGFATTLNTNTLGANHAISLPNEDGTICLQNSTNCGFAPSTGGTGYIQLQGSSPGTAQTGNINVSGTTIAGTSVLSPLVDTPTAVALNIGTTNATAINLKKSTVITGGLTQSGGAVSLTGNAASSLTTTTGGITIQAAGTNTLALNTAGAGVVELGNLNSTTISIGRGSDIARTINIGNVASATTAQTITMGSVSAGSVTTIQGGTGSGAITLAPASGGNIALTTTGAGNVNVTTGSGGLVVKSLTDNAAAFRVQTLGGVNLLNVNTLTSIVGVGMLLVTNPSGFDATIDTALGATINLGTSAATALNIGNTSAPIMIQGSSASVIKAKSGSFTTTLGFTTPTANRTVNIGDESGTICIQNSANCGFLTGSAASYIQNTTTLQNANIAVQAAASGTVVAVLQANAAGTADILSLRNGGGTPVATFGYNGMALFKNSANSTTAFQIQNATGAGLLVVDSTNGLVGVGGAPAFSKFEVNGGDAAIYNNGNNTRLILGDSTTTGQYGWLQWDSTNDYFRIETAGSNGLKINDNNVTIGNVFPSKPLIVASGTTPLLEVGSTGQIISHSSTNGTAVFQMQNAGGASQFALDTTNSRIILGTSGGDATGTTLVLGNKTGSSTDPTGTNGAMYYNTTLAKFRCYENGSWKNCMNSDATTIASVQGQAAAILTKANAGSIVVAPFYVPARITVTDMRMAVVTTALGAAGDVGIYDSNFNLVLNGGSSSLTTATGVKIIPTLQTGNAQVLEAGQYYVAMTWNSSTGSVAAAAQGAAMMKRTGNFSAGGGLVLPSTLNFGVNFTQAQAIPSIMLEN